MENGNIPSRVLSSDQWNSERLLSVLDGFKGKRILVLGDVGIDRYTVGEVERISPEAPVPVVLVRDEILKLGLAANVADNVRVLGGSPVLIGVVGTDRAAEDFVGILERSGISAKSLVQDSSRRTVLKERIVSDRQQLLRVDYESQHGISATIEAQILNLVEAALPSVDAVVIEDYAKGMITPHLASAVLKLAQVAGKLTAVDPNSRTSPELYRGVKVLTPNSKEAEHLAGMKITDVSSLGQAGATILKRLNCQYLVITRGKDGMAIFKQGAPEMCLIPTYAREVYDVSGAGDTVISVVVLGLVSGATIEEAVVLGNLAAGVEVGKRGTATVSPDEVKESLRNVLSS